MMAPEGLWSVVQGREGDPLWRVVAYLSAAVERMSVHDGTRVERVLAAFELWREAERVRLDPMPRELGEAFAHVRGRDGWVRTSSPTLRELGEMPERELGYVVIGIVRAFHVAVHLHAAAMTNKRPRGN